MQPSLLDTDCNSGCAGSSSYDLLLVEDCPLQQTALRMLLLSLGHKVMIAADGAEAIAAVKTRRFDAILMDCQMSPVDGLEATRKIRCMNQFNARQIVIIGISASATAEEGIEAGMNDFMCKPINRAHLQNVLYRWLGCPK